MRFICIVLFHLFVVSVVPHGDEYDDYVVEATFSEIEDDFEKLRNVLALSPEKLFQLGKLIDTLHLEPQNGSTVLADLPIFREKFAEKLFNLVEELFELEKAVRTLYQDQPEDEAEHEHNDTEEDDNVVTCGTWNLGMNLNPTDGHIMHYAEGWNGNSPIGNSSQALEEDYLDQAVWNYLAANYIAIVRHDGEEVQAVKTFKTNYDQGYSLQEMFNSNSSNADFYRQVVGVLVQDEKLSTTVVSYDPIFSVGGNLAINWGFSNNGVRMVMTNGELEASGTDSYDTRGLGAHYHCNPVAGYTTSSAYPMEISSTDSYSSWPKAIGTDYGSYGNFYSYTSSYGQYAIYVSEDASSFPEPGSQLEAEMGTC